MEPHFQTSFIPKKQIGNDSDYSDKVHETDILSLAATLFAIVTILLSGGLFFYKSLLLKQIAKADAEVNAARSAIEPDQIKELIDANSKIKASVSLLEKHVATSNLLYILGDLAVKKFRFTDFTYSSKNGIPVITAQAEVQTYNALAQQHDLFSKSEYLKNPIFSGINLNETGNVKFAFTSSVNLDAVSYKKALEALTMNP
ncbi:MAG: putative pilN [Parcubacteria bacterium C7867-003]|nr:MAG: putative pilN [Parcubacteria bacterium C7867-003]